MFAVVQNGEVRQIIQPDVGFTIGEKQYSARFIRNATEEERKAIGVYEIIQGEQKDQRFYWVDGPKYRVNEVNQTVEASYTAQPKELDGLKSNFIAQTKATAGSMLAASDWKVVRAAEGVKPCDQATLDFRAAVRAYSDTLETAITAAASVEDLISVLNSQDWPKEQE